jgi:hypothetical protein
MVGKLRGIGDGVGRSGKAGRGRDSSYGLSDTVTALSPLLCALYWHCFDCRPQQPLHMPWLQVEAAANFLQPGPAHRRLVDEVGGCEREGVANVEGW